MLKTPVVFLVFRRPDLTAQVFESIRQAQPQKLFVVADGARNEEGEAELCQKARKVTEQIDWNCEVFRNYSDINLGCKKRVSSGLDWVFSQVESAIILEDDCLPHPSFFTFCDSLLSYYLEDNRIWVISGDNFQDGQWRGDGSYYFSRYPHCWGWATWRRAWKHYSNELELWPTFKNLELLNSIFQDPLEQQFWTQIWDCIHKSNQSNSWNYCWTFKCMSNSALVILPNVNLVSNIGFRSDGTHTNNSNLILANIPVTGTSKIRHPSFVVRDSTADLYTFNNIFGGNAIRAQRHWKNRLRQKLTKFKKKLFCSR